jgi:hypothetical protein
METQLRRYFFGVIGFAFVITSATLGVTDAILAVIVGGIAMNAGQLVRLRERARIRSAPERRPRRVALAARPMHAEHAYQLVPDDPSLILSTQPGR